MRKIAIASAFLLSWIPLSFGAGIAPLYSRGYVVMPEPQKVTLGESDFRFGTGWRIETGPGVKPGDVAVEALREDLASRFDFQFGNGRNTLQLTMAPNSVAVGVSQDSDKKALAEQAYRIELTRARVTVTANAPAGLFYGVETLVQLIKPRNGGLWLPEGEIVDWPDLRLRQIYWDDAHHLDRPETLKRAIRQAAFFKINGFALKLEGHFQFASAPAIVEPYAMTPGQYQELTNYGLKYHVQLIPYLDGPAHIAFILKHSEYSRLREYPESNYELCATNPDSYKLMFGLFQDLIAANRGVDYFYLSTDEPYYIGLADNRQCQEGARAKQLGGVGKLLAEYVTKTANFLRDRGRTVIFWGEYPLKQEDVASLPAHLVNGEVYGPQFDALFRKHGIREMIYTSSEGEEKLFPQYFALAASRRLHPGGRAAERVAEAFRKISFDSARRDADLIGAVNAGWADMGLHPETFWLGYATASAAAWHAGSPDPRESMSAFYILFYGWNAVRMDRLYQLMSTQAQFWSDSWDTIPSTARKGIWGNSAAIYDQRRPARDQAVPLPPAPGADLSYHSDWAESNATRLKLADEFQAENEELFGLLHENLRRVETNRYNLAVYLSITQLYRQNLEMLRAIGRMDELLRSASEAAQKNRTSQAVQAIDRALDVARRIQWDRNGALRDAREIWYRSWYPRVEEANGRKFLHELDDVKDHLPDRTVDMSYLVYREIQLPFGDWVRRILAERNQYAGAHKMPLRNDPFDWKDLKAVSGSEVGAISLE